MAVWRTCLVVLMLSWQASGIVPQVCPNLSTNTCYYENVAKLLPKTADTQRYVAVAGLFDVTMRADSAYTCGTQYNPTGLLHTEAFLWSVDYWQRNLITAIDPNLSIGGVVFDSCMRTEQLLQNILGFEQCNVRVQNFDRRNVVGFVGPLRNEDAMAAAALTRDMDLTVISPTADSAVLSDSKMYSYFMRTTPSTQNDVDILGHVLRHSIQTRYVTAIYQQDMMSTFELFKRKMAADGVCITASYAMTGTETNEVIATQVLTIFLQGQMKTKFVALFLSPQLTKRLFDELTKNRDLRGNFVFLMTSDIKSANTVDVFLGNTVATNNAIVLERVSPPVIATAVNAFKTHWEVVRAGTRPASPAIDNPWLKNYLQAGNSLPAFAQEAAYTIMATEAIIKGTQDAGWRKCNSASNFVCATFLNADSRGADIFGSIRSTTNYFTASMQVNGTTQYLNGDLRAERIIYYLHRMRDGMLSQFAQYTPGNNITGDTLRTFEAYSAGLCPDSPCLQCNELPSTTTSPPTTTTLPGRTCPPIETSNQTAVYYPYGQEITGAYSITPRQNSEFTTRFDIGHRWIIALGVLAGVGILSVIIFEIYILYKLLGTSMGHKWRTMWLGQLLLFGIFLCYLTLFAYLPVPTKATCGITRFGVGVSYSICFGVLLVKLMVILTSKSSESSLLPSDADSPNYLKGVYQFLMFVFVVGVQVVIDTQWLITVPPEAVKVKSNNDQEVWVCNHYTFSSSHEWNDMSEFVRSEFENHVLSLVYIMFLILITTLLALSAHGIITNHRESVFIGIASGFSIPIWLAWTLLGGLNNKHDFAQEFGDACIAFGLFLTATLILFAMFLPKVRQLVNMGVEGIYFEDDRETIYAGSVIMAPPSYKSRPNSVIYVNNQGIYSEPVVLGNGDPNTTYLRHPGAGSTYSAPATYLKKGGDSTLGGGSRVLRVTDDLSGRRPLEKRPQSEIAYGTAGRPRSTRGTLPRSRSQTNLGAL